MTPPPFLLAVLPAALLACNSDAGARSPTPPVAAAPVQTSAPALPADQQCIPASICERWSGCALVARGPRYWKVIASDAFPTDELVEVTNLCSGGHTCIAARGIPRGAPCPDLTTPILVSPPGYTCVWNGKTCSKT